MDTLNENYLEKLTKDVGKNIKTLRENNDLNQKETAEKIGISSQSLSRYEKGERIMDIYVAQKLAKLFGVSIDMLCGDITQKEELDFPLFISNGAGLSFNALKFFLSHKNTTIISSGLDLMIESNYFGEMIGFLHMVKKSSQELVDLQKEQDLTEAKQHDYIWENQINGYKLSAKEAFDKILNYFDERNVDNKGEQNRALSEIFDRININNQIENNPQLTLLVPDYDNSNSNKENDFLDDLI